MEVVSTLDYSQDFSKYVKYDEESPTCLSWTVFDNYHSNKKKCGSLVNDSRSGKKSCTRVWIGKEHYLCHRIIWTLFNGSIPENHVVDHINGDPWDNKITNLRLLSKPDNTRNRSKPNNNTSGNIGVSLRSDGRFVAFWSDDYKLKTKSFNVSKYGYDEARRLAVIHREEQINLLENQGIFYSDRHGD